MDYGFGYMEARSAMLFNPNIKSNPAELRRHKRLLAGELLNITQTKTSVADITRRKKSARKASWIRKAFTTLGKTKDVQRRNRIKGVDVKTSHSGKPAA
jgi:hypothetical protein